MTKNLACTDIVEHIHDFIAGKLSAENESFLCGHISSCEGCRQAVDQLRAVKTILGEVLPEMRPSAGFERITSARLSAVTRLPTEVANEELSECSAPQDGFLDAISRRFGAAPWWAISGMFHGLLILLLFLIGMAIMQINRNDTVIVTSLERKKEKEPEKEPPPRDVFKNPQPLDTTEAVNPQPEAIVHEEVVVSDRFETDDNLDSHDAFGDEGVSDIPLGSSGFSGAIGVGGGAAGAFGRPLGGGGQRLRRAEAGGGDKKTESAVDKGLEWLARNQEPGGHWDSRKHGADARGKHCDAAMTGFALLAFLGAGHTEKVGKYKDNVRRAVKWLIDHQEDNGALVVMKEEWVGYSHAIAGMALAEAAAMGRVAETRTAAQKAIEYSVNVHQCGEGSDKRGWRYKAKTEGDLSVSGWFIMQLKSARVAGLQVPHGGFEGAEWFLNHVESKDVPQNFRSKADYENGRHRYGYTGPGQSSRTTAIGCLCRMFLGTPAEEVSGATSWLVDHYSGDAMTHKPDLYLWYYLTLCAFQQGGEVWKKWNTDMKSILVRTQRQGGPEDGSWDPAGQFSQNWGRVGQTALSIMCLEVYYRYLPMYR